MKPGPAVDFLKEKFFGKGGEDGQGEEEEDSQDASKELLGSSSETAASDC